MTKQKLQSSSARPPDGFSPDPLGQQGDPPSPSRQAIAQRAYEKYVARGRVDGAHLEDWDRACRELRAELGEKILAPNKNEVWPTRSKKDRKNDRKSKKTGGRA